MKELHAEANRYAMLHYEASTAILQRIVSWSTECTELADDNPDKKLAWRRLCGEQLDEIHQLRWFTKVNIEALCLFKTKFSSLAPSSLEWGGEMTGQWTECLDIPKDCLDRVGKAESTMTIFMRQLEDAEDEDEEWKKPRASLRKGFLTTLSSVDLAPLHSAILSDDLSALRSLLQALSSRTDGSGSDFPSMLGHLLILSIRCAQDTMVEHILSKGPSLAVKSADGKTALYCVCESGHLSLVRTMVAAIDSLGGDINQAVPRTGWTPLMVASAKGHADIVSYLLASGADTARTDVLGWTAKEHAAYRGHLTIASFERFGSANTYRGGPAAKIPAGKRDPIQPLHYERKAVVVTLGTVQGGHDRPTLDLGKYGLASSLGDFEASETVLEIVIPGADCEAKEVPLPITNDHIKGPLVGLLGLNAPTRITVNLWHTGPEGERVTLSSGTVLLGDDYVKFGKSRESMLREVTVVMLDKETLEYSGTVLLSYVIATPFVGMGGTMTDYTKKAGEPPRLVGHRGLGQNTAGQSNLQIGENTITSFLSAHRLGAPFVEFDVQLTRDLEAVIYHDFSFSGSGSDVPIHDISLAQYKYAGDVQNPRDSVLLDAISRRPRASSSGEDSMLKALQAKERLKHTIDFGGKGFKANTRGHSIQDAFATLEELLVNLPEDMGFNIEMKYQRLHEARDAGVASVTIDINTFVDVALEKIKRLAGRRPIILSSFTPEVCILLKLKQSKYPVMFITNAGKVPMMDKELRAASLQMGIQFARLWDLAGLVLACDTYLLCPRLIGLVKNAGLVCASYGLGNNDPVNARVCLSS